MNLQNRYDNLVKYYKKRTDELNIDIVNNVVDGYDRHHIVPCCLGGDWIESNLIFVTRKEHAHLHFLLAKIHKTNNKLNHAYTLLKYAKTPQMMPKDSEEYKVLYQANNERICVNGWWGHDRVKCICLDTGKWYNSISEAYKDYPDCSNINSAVHGYLRFCNGNHHFMSYERYKNATKEEIDNILGWNITRVRRDSSKPVVCIDTNVMFRSASDAIDYYSELGVSLPKMYNVLVGDRKKTGGLRWRYATEDEVKLINYEDSTTIMYSLSNEEMRSS